MYISSGVEHRFGKDTSLHYLYFNSLLQFNCKSDRQLDGPAVENTIIVPNFTTGGTVLQKWSPVKGVSQEPQWNLP